MPNRVLVSIHGVETEGKWQEKIDPSFEGIDDFAYRKYKYGKFDFWNAALQSRRDEEVERFAALYDDLKKENCKNISVIAHSFGTYIVGAALLRFNTIHLNALILCGSILATDFDWSALVRDRRVKRILNEKAGDDWVVTKFRGKVLPALVPHSGPSGVDGFSQRLPELQQRDNASFKHSDHFILVEHCNRYWRPFIFDNVQFAALCWRAAEDDDDAWTQLRADYHPMLVRLVKQLLPEVSDEVAAAHADTVLRSIVEDGYRGIYNAHELAVAKVGKLWIDREKQHPR
jgi:pimeloyl-ACP methyl ester carboxylesterase